MSVEREGLVSCSLEPVVVDEVSVLACELLAEVFVELLVELLVELVIGLVVE